MNNAAKLPKTQATALEILAAAGELERGEWRLRGANLNAIDALKAKQLVTTENRRFINERHFEGPTEMMGTFYRLA